MSRPTQLPPQTQDVQPGTEAEMQPKPDGTMHRYRGSGKLLNKVALISGGDSGIGRAAAVAFAKEGADVAIVYLNEHDDAQATKAMVEEAGKRCLTLSGDLGDKAFCESVVAATLQQFGKLDVLVNNAAQQYPQGSLEDISEEQLLKTFRTNVFSMFFLTQAALPHLPDKARIINTTSVTAYRGSSHLLDYAATKGAIVAFTRSLAAALADRKIIVNAVAPGPIWTPLIPSTFTEEKVASFGKDVPLQRPGQPEEVAPCYVFLAAEESSSYMSGQVLHPNGGVPVNG